MDYAAAVHHYMIALHHTHMPTAPVWNSRLPMYLKLSSRSAIYLILSFQRLDAAVHEIQLLADTLLDLIWSVLTCAAVNCSGSLPAQQPFADPFNTSCIGKPARGTCYAGCIDGYEGGGYTTTCQVVGVSTSGVWSAPTGVCRSKSVTTGAARYPR